MAPMTTDQMREPIALQLTVPWRLCRTLTTAFALWTPALAVGQAESADPGWWRGDHASGDWCGLRDEMEAAGFALSVEYTGDAMANVSGGLQTGAAYLQLFQFGLNWNPEALIPGWKGATFRASGIYPYQTRSVTLDLVGDLNGVDNIEAPNGPRLYEVWYQQGLWDDAFTFQVGNLLVDESFAFNELASVFINGGFGWSQFVAANTGAVVPAYPFAAPGVRLEYRPSARTYIQAGVYDGDALDNVLGDPAGNPNGIQFQLNGDQGVFAIAELGWQLNQQEGDTGLPGTYKVGGFYHSATFGDLYYDENGNSFVVSGLDPKSYSGDFMLYAAAEQIVWREAHEEEMSQGLGLFFRLGAGPADRNPINLVIDGGLYYQGLIPGRDNDAFGLGIIYAGISDELRRQEEDDRQFNGANIPALSDYEIVVELTYQAVLNNWWYLQPDLQWIGHPGGSSATPDAWVIGVRTGISF